MDKPGEKAVLLFCKTCGCRRLHDVIEELQKLFTERNVKPNVCGICQKQVGLEKDCKPTELNIKKEILTDDDYEDVNFSAHLSKSTSKTASKVDQNKSSDDTQEDHAMFTRLSTGASKVVTYTTMSTEDDCVSSISDDGAADSESDNGGDGSESDGGESEEEMIVELDGLIETEETAEASTVASGKPNIIYRKYLDPELKKFLATSNDSKSPLVCNRCQEPFKFIGTFAKHISRHTHKKPMEKPFRCHECQKNFELRAFKKHLKTHVKSFKCTYSRCRFTFKTEKTLKKHLEVHKGLRRHSCKVCGAGFLEKRDLDKHEVNHDKKKKMRCEFCNKTYNHIAKLRTHVRRAHADKKYKCKVCPYSCYTTEDLEKHIHVHPKGNFKCSKCQHTFSSQAAFDFHLQINSCKMPVESADGEKSKTDADGENSKMDADGEDSNVVADTCNSKKGVSDSNTDANDSKIGVDVEESKKDTDVSDSKKDAEISNLQTSAEVCNSNTSAEVSNSKTSAEDSNSNSKTDADVSDSKTNAGVSNSKTSGEVSNSKTSGEVSTSKTDADLQDSQTDEDFGNSKMDADVDITDVLEYLDAGLVPHMAKPRSVDMPFKCKHCAEKEFTSAHLFHQHIQLSHPKQDCSAITHFYHCNKCSRKYGHRCDLTKHLKSHSDNRPYVCAYENCEKAFKRKDTLSKHQDIHAAAGDTMKNSTLEEDDIIEILQWLDPTLKALIHTPRSKEFPFSCKYCDMKEFKSANICLNHIKQKHPEIDCPITHAYRCSHCNQTFEMKATLSRHILSHSDYKPYVCTIDDCNKSFNRKDKLKDHQKRHVGEEKRHMCSTCGNWFSSTSGLNTHMKVVHMRAYEHLCSFCGKGFPIKSKKDNHEKSKHLGMKIWVCELCGKSYNKRVELTQHMYYHSGEKPYACDYCEYRCVRLDYLKKHVKTHTEEKPYKCSICNLGFSLRSTLIIHMKRHHGFVTPDKIEKVDKDVIPVTIKKGGSRSRSPRSGSPASLIPTASGRPSFFAEETESAVGFLQVFKESCNM